MYFPILRGKRFELAALRDFSDRNAESNFLLPIIEPVRRGGLAIALNKLIDDGSAFAFIANPMLGEFSAKPRTLESDFIEEYLDEYDNYHPAMYVDMSTSSRSVSDFAAKFDVQALFCIIGSPDQRVCEAIKDAEPAYVSVREGRVSSGTVRYFLEQGIELIRINDSFNRQIRNSDYPNQEFFSDTHLNLGDYTHFGDYSIVGDAYSEGGGAAYTVALHHVVQNPQSKGSLDIRHYKSDYSESPSDVAGKFFQALSRLVEDPINSSEENLTSAFDDYKRLFDERHFPGLGFAKKLAILQHFEIVNSLLSSI